MLNITPQRNAEGAKSYFAQSDYLSQQQEITGQWGGKGAVLLGLSGQVDKRSFDALCDNLHPATGKPLTKITFQHRRVGFDATWSAPKSISVIHALTGDEAIVDAFRKSINETMAEMEQEMQARVRKNKQEFDRTTGNICYAEFIHLTSRPVMGQVCPQLHAHLFCFNASYDAVEKQFKAAQFGKIKQDAYYWQAVQQTRFANELQALGYSVCKTKDAFEIEGVPESVIRKFSLRASLIDRVAEKLGITSAKSKAKLAATTREAKDNSKSYDELKTMWESWLTPEEAGAIGIVAQEKAPREPMFRDADHARFAVGHVFERASVIDERRLLTAALRHGLGEVTPEGVRSEVNRHGLLKREDDERLWVTTKEVLAEESRMLAFARSGKGSCRPLMTASDIRLEDQRLNAGQRSAVEHVLTSADRVMIIRGRAGTGKSTLAKEAVARIEDCGKRVVMLAPSAEASRGVLRSEGFDEADTLARFLCDRAMQETARGGFIWLDEAGLAGSHAMAQLFELARGLDARVVLSGDSRQLAPVDRGAPLRVLEEIAGLLVAEVTEIQRQKRGDYKEAVQLISMGHIVEGFEKLDAMGCVKLLPDRDSYAPVAEEYVEKWEQANDRDKNRAVLIVCPMHKEGEQITEAVRGKLREKGILAAHEREFTRLVPLHWTEAERADPRHYAGDEVLQFHHNTGAFKAGQRVRAEDALSALPDAQPKHFSVYAPATIRISAGDTIRVTGNGKTLDGHKINNGAVYRVSGFTAGGHLNLSNGWVLGKEFGQICHGYVSTAQAAQGRTCDHVLFVQSAESSPASSREGFYVGVSRGRSISIFTDDKRELKAAIERSRPRPSATELVAKPKPQLWRRFREAVMKVQQSAMLAAKQAAYHLRENLQSRGKEFAYER